MALVTPATCGVVGSVRFTSSLGGNEGLAAVSDSKGAWYGTAHSIRREQRAHRAGRSEIHRLLVPADPAGHAGRVLVRLRHLQHRVGPELCALQPEGAGRGLPGVGCLARCGGRRDPGRAHSRPLRPEGPAHRGRRHLRGRLHPVRGDARRRHPAGRPHPDRPGHRGRLGHRHRLHRRVRPQGPARRPVAAAAVDDHGRHPGRLPHRLAHLRPLAQFRRLGRLAADPRPRCGPRPARPGPAHHDAGVAALVAAARQVRSASLRPEHPRGQGRQRRGHPGCRPDHRKGRGRRQQGAAP